MRQMNKVWEKASQAAADAVEVLRKTLADLQYANETLEMVQVYKQQTIQELNDDCLVIQDQINANKRLAQKINDILN